MTTIENDWLKVHIAKEGAEIRSVTHKKNAIDYMWSGDSEYWGRVAPVLFPIVGRLKDDQYELNGQTYSLTQHGFLRDVTFEVNEQKEGYASFLFESDGQFKNIYPYEFTAIIHYTLNENSLSVKWEIINKNDEDMYFSIGAHPAFKLPLVEGEEVSDYMLHITPQENEKVMQYELKNALVHEKGAITDLSTIQLDDSLFVNDAVIYSHIRRIDLQSQKSEHGVEVSFDHFPFVGIWSKYDDKNHTMAPFVCIEPWYGIADMHNTTGDLKEKFGINRLAANETFQRDYTMTFK